MLKLPGGASVKLTPSQIEAAQKVRATLMPEGMLENLSLEEAADLLEFVSARK
jgi:hypothetical protein